MSLGHGGNVEEIKRKFGINEKIYDFSANINPLGINKKVKNEMIKALDKIESYPDITYHNLKEGIKKFEEVDYENIILGNGAAEVIFNISRGLKPKKAILMAPTFSEYEDSLRSIDCKIEYYKMDKDFLIKEDFLEKLTEDIDITFICNPNNPTGKLTSKRLLLDILERGVKNNITIVVDESFLDFLENKNEYSLVKYIEKYNNLIVVKSLTKFFAFPGIRLGYGLTKNKDYIEKINKISIAWNVNTIALYGGVQALKEEAYMRASREYLREEKNFLLKSLEKFEELEIYSGSVNYIFFKVKIDIDLKTALLNKNILIRSCENYINLEKGYYRIAVRRREENKILIQALEQIFGKRREK